MEQRTIHTIGHSNLGLDELIGLLTSHGLRTVADVRSMPHSRHVPWFNREALPEALETRGIQYVYLGDQLGGRPGREDLHGANGRADHESMARDGSFQNGILDLELIAQEGPVVVMCTEPDPLDCHRTLLVGRKLSERGNRVVHVMRNGRKERHCEAMSRLMSRWHLPEPGATGVTLPGMIEQAVQQQVGRVACRKRQG